MTAFSDQVLLAWLTLVQPLNLAAVVVGVMLGLVLTPLILRVGIQGPTALVLIFPVASMLDPVTGVMLLAATFGATNARLLAASNPPAQLTALVALTLGVILAGGVSLGLAAAPAAAWLQDLAPADTTALLVIAAVAATGMAVTGGRQALKWALLAMTIGLALQLSPWAPLDAERRSPLPVLLGALIIGPAVWALIAPRRVAAAMAGSASGDPISNLAGLLPAFLLGTPVTLAAALITLNLAENGLILGPRLMAQRPKLVLGFVAALLLSTLLTVGFQSASRWLRTRVGHRSGVASETISPLAPTAPPTPKTTTGTTVVVVTRAMSLIIMVLAFAAFYRSGIDQDGELSGLDGAAFATLAIATLAGTLAAARSADLALIVVGLVIGQLLALPLAGSIDAADGHITGALMSGSWLLKAGAVLAVAVVVAKPLRAGWATSLNRWRPAAPADPGAQ